MTNTLLKQLCSDGNYEKCGDYADRIISLPGNDLTARRRHQISPFLTGRQPWLCGALVDPFEDFEFYLLIFIPPLLY
jgi:hypothetical protein